MKIAILGYGVVGKGVKQIIDLLDDSIEVKRILLHRGNSDECFTLDFEQIVQDIEITHVVECIGGLHPAYEYVKQAIMNRKHVVTSNKKMFATYGVELFELAKQYDVHLSFSATTGGGIPWLRHLMMVRQVEPIEEMVGIFNGTTNFILTQKEGDYHERLALAQKLGYAEADPTDDVKAFDVAYKCCISLMMGFGVYVDPKMIPCFGIDHMDQRAFDYAKERGCEIRLVAHMFWQDHLPCAYIMPKMIDHDSLFRVVVQNQNAMYTQTKQLGVSAVMGQGAGQLPTANAVVHDLIHPFSLHQVQPKSLSLTHQVKVVVMHDLIEEKQMSLQELCEYQKQYPTHFVMEV